jgi:hypothetical protein
MEESHKGLDTCPQYENSGYACTETIQNMYRIIIYIYIYKKKKKNGI